jgi:endoglucanase
MRMVRSGAAVGLISIPLRYMHSPIEVLSLGDVEQSIELLVATLLSFPADASFAREQP